MIDIANLSFSYGKKVALDDVTLTFEKGEAVILAGANGSGKTTLLRTICGVLFFKKGRIMIDNSGVSSITRSKTAYIPSSLSLYDSFKLKEVVKFHSSFYKEFNYKKIGDYTFDLNQKVSSLSRGEKTLFFLTLALSTDPDYLLIDDVIHFLDPHLRDIFLNSILQLRYHWILKELLIGWLFSTGEKLFWMN
jgi:ABC-2 type transport system ATP-binding protein